MVNGMCGQREQLGEKTGARPIQSWNVIAILPHNGSINAHFDFNSLMIQDWWLNPRVIFFCKLKGGKLLKASSQT